MKAIKKVIIFIILVFIVITTVVILQGYKMYKNAIDIISLDNKVAEIREDGNFTTINEIPTDYKNAVIAVEDHRFYTHNGIDIISIGRAIVTNIKSMDIVEGGSTITQQVAKNMYFSQKQEFTRKVAEIFLAFDLEKNYSKDEIFELYINTSYFGSGYYGIKEASNGYFNKEPIDMSISESTLIAGVPNAPSVYSPKENPELAKQRQKKVINAMVKYNYLSEEEAKQIE